MASCEKCWAAAYRAAYWSSDGQAECYERIRSKRDAEGHTCSPEDQAGPDATECPECHRVAAHQHCRICMACGYDPAAEEVPRG